ncbi:MAG: hypothetical protein J6R40_04705, partial [Clostridia bacterium]|nr:hypothetical protein [Clostridia bacterium]
LADTKEELEGTQGDLADTKEELEAPMGKLDETKNDLKATQSALEQASAEAQRNLATAKADLAAEDQKANTSRTVAIVIASTALGCNVAIIGLAIFLERKKKLFGTLFSLAKK